MTDKTQTTEKRLTITRLSSGYWHIRGAGPCNWAQPPTMPCSEEVLRSHASPEAGEQFLRAAIAACQEQVP